MELVNQDQLTQMDVQLDLESRQHLFDASKWSKFLSVIVFIACALVLVFGIMGGKSIISAMEKFYPNQEMIRTWEERCWPFLPSWFWWLPSFTFFSFSSLPPK